MSALLDIVAEARAIRDEAEAQFQQAIVNAARFYSLRQVAEVAGMNFSSVKKRLEREETDDTR